MVSWSVRLSVLLPAVLLLAFVFMYARSAYLRYWVLRDGVQGTATITGEGSHHSVYYTYAVAGINYTGQSHRDPRDIHYDEPYSEIGVGGKTSVWYSASHPWLSSLPKPKPTLYGWPPVLLALAFASLFLITVVAPRSKWSMVSGQRGRAG